MKPVTEILLARAKCGVDMAIADLELAQAQLAAAAGFETLPETTLDMPTDFEAVLATLQRQRLALGEIITTSLAAPRPA